MKKKTSEVSKLVGVSRRTLQYYDDVGLVQVERSEKNHRLYDETSVRQIWKIMLYKEMGYRLDEIGKIMQLSESEERRYLMEQKKIICDHIRELDIQIRIISYIEKNGMPLPPAENEGINYVDGIEKWKNKILKQ